MKKIHKIYPKMDKFSLAIIMGICRRIKIPSGLTKGKMLETLGAISDKEVEYVDVYQKITKTQDIQNIILDGFEYHTPTRMLKYLESINYESFPIPLTYIPDKNRKEKIITYFYINKLKVTVPFRIYTEEQEKAINSLGLCIVNAGPGTGKTTVACNKAFTLENEGVIFISYTNAAVKEDKLRMYEYPIDDKRIKYSTVDSLAACICGSISESYDLNIREAINLVERNMIGSQLLNYKHLIIDESQDVDDLRFELIGKLYLTSYFKSLTIFGDPRQQISENVGNWYAKMWIESKNGTCNLFNSSIPITRIGFTNSQRFQSQEIVNLVNSLSKRREDIHYELKSKNCKPGICPIIIFDSDIMERIVILINKLVNNGASYSDFMFISPSISSSNLFSKVVKQISSYLRYKNIPCKLSSEGQYHAEGILFTTIQSAKGKEADYVFLVGLNNYTNNFHMIPYHVAESLIFVAHSRAKKNMFYLLHDVEEIVLPRGIKRNFIDKDPSVTKIKEETFEIKEHSGKSVVSSLCSDFDFNKLMTTNEYELYNEYVNFNFLEMSASKEENDFYGVLTGVAIGIFCENKLPDIILKFMNGNYKVVKDKIYRYLKKYSTDFVDGIMLSERGTLIISEGQKENIKNIEHLVGKNVDELTIKDFYDITVLFVQLSFGYTIYYNGEYDSELIPYWKENSLLITENFGPVIGVEFNVRHQHVSGSIDIMTENAIIEIKTKNNVDYADFMQVYLYKVLNDNEEKDAILLNLKKQECYLVTSNKILLQWKYMLEKYTQILISQAEIKNKMNMKEEKISFKQQNTFTVDTEFNMLNKNKIESIFEISIYNYNDPYKSIISIVNNGKINQSAAVEWLKIDKVLYEHSPPMVDIIRQFNSLIKVYKDTVPILYYFIADIDVCWSSEADKINFANKISTKGFYENTNKIAKLIDVYNSKCDFIDSRKELKHHTALSDTIMLYELIVLN